MGPIQILSLEKRTRIQRQIQLIKAAEKGLETEQVRKALVVAKLQRMS